MATPTFRSVAWATPIKGTATVNTDAATAANDTVFAFQAMSWIELAELSVNPVATGVSDWSVTKKYLGTGTQIGLAIWKGTVQTSGVKAITFPLPVSNTGRNYAGIISCNGTHLLDGTGLTFVSTDEVESLIVPAITPTQADSALFLFTAIIDYAGVNTAHIATPPGMTKYTSPYGPDKEQETALYLQTLASSSNTGTRVLVPNVGYTDGFAAIMFAITKSVSVVVTPPTVDAGADVLSQTISTPFSRTALESANGAAISARNWKIQSGPAGAGTTIGSAAALSGWTPTTLGAYVLRYSATNSAGTSFDDMNITVANVVVDPGTPLPPPPAPPPSGTTSGWSNEVTGGIKLSGAWIHQPGQEADGLVLPYGGVGRTQALDRAKTSLQFVGREYPVYDVGEARAESIQITSQIIVEDGDVETKADRLRDIGRDADLVLFRDGRGRKMYCMPSDWSMTDLDMGAYEVSFLLNRVDYDEALPGV